MSFLRNVWYAVAWSKEVADRPIGRTVIGEPVVLFRSGDGAAIAFADRCPHRHAPLSLGRVEGDRLRCMYHGMQLGPDGRCVHVPGSDRIPAGASVKTYPLIEKDSWIWLWPGDPARADPALIPAAFGLDTGRWTMREGAIDYAANYQLINDNLTDLSHLDYVHDTTLGAASGSRWSDEQPEVTVLERGLRIERWFSDVPSARDPEVRNDVWNCYHYWLPGVFVMNSHIYPAGARADANGGEPRGEPLLHRVEQQAVTPIDALRTRYLFATGFEASKLPPAMLEPAFAVVTAAFAEDKAMIEAQQRIWDLTPANARKVFLPQDKAPAQFRAMLSRAIAAEVPAG